MGFRTGIKVVPTPHTGIDNSVTTVTAPTSVTPGSPTGPIRLTGNLPTGAVVSFSTDPKVCLFANTINYRVFIRGTACGV
jgi:hypothetical protein